MWVLLVVPLMDWRRTVVAARTDAPDVLIEHPGLLVFPDPLHVTLPDGRTFRLAHLVAPDPSSPLYPTAIDNAWSAIGFGGNVKRGLRIVGTNAAGETLVEMWGLQPSLGGCGNRTWAEERAGRIPRWQRLTDRLVDNGTHYLEPGVTDPALRGAEGYARHAGNGVWRDPAVIRQRCDLEALERFAVHGVRPDPEDPWLRTREDAADLLLRADPVKYKPVLLDIVTGTWEQRLDARVRIALALHKGGHMDGTEFLMNAVRQGRYHGGDGSIGSGFTNPIVQGYGIFWNRGFDDVHSVLAITTRR